MPGLIGHCANVSRMSLHHVDGSEGIWPGVDIPKVDALAVTARVSVMFPLCFCHVSVMFLSCFCHVSVMFLSCFCYVSVMFLLVSVMSLSRCCLDSVMLP